eukprot:gnl/MRDRNA2_/MRDRNA2_29808_c0_seq1.p1 gnl/MRDRNA2_/MRDRNA2_29808_c0~~gnl/MRDRNA2_/MRDRNA2_29808_c0_seq1.p1  ORF type:complete len:567 (+),score=70.48 gnl/MRDRNA2_/MRDRNA2_29808_c0_seq1:217-1701(+)
MEAQRRSTSSRSSHYRMSSPDMTLMSNMDLVDGPLDTGIENVSQHAESEEPEHHSVTHPRPQRVFHSHSPSAFFRSSVRTPSPDPERWTPALDQQVDVATPELIRGASPAWITALCQKTAAERLRANDDDYLSDEEHNGMTPTPPPIRPRDKPVRLAYSKVPPRQNLLPLGGIDGRATSPACPPSALHSHATRQRLAEAQRPPRPQTTEPTAPKAPKRPHSVIGVSHQEPEPQRPHSVMGRGYTNKQEVPKQEVAAASPDLSDMLLALSPQNEDRVEAAPRPHSVMGHGPTRPHSVMGQAQRPHSVVGSAPSTSKASSDQNNQALRGNIRRPLQGQRVPEHSDSPDPQDHSILRKPKPDVVQRSQTPRDVVQQSQTARDAQRSQTPMERPAIEKPGRSSQESKAPKHGPVFDKGYLGSVAMAWGGFSKVSKQAAGALMNSSMPTKASSKQVAKHAPPRNFDYSTHGVSRLQAHTDAPAYHGMTRTPRVSGAIDS